MNRNGLSAESWWRSIPTSKCSLVPRLDFTYVVAPRYISCTNLMYTSGIYRFRMYLHSTLRSTVSYAFSKSTNTMSRGLFQSLYFLHRSWWQIFHPWFRRQTWNQIVHPKWLRCPWAFGRWYAPRVSECGLAAWFLCSCCSSCGLPCLYR